jgi:hypothetical protein
MKTVLTTLLMIISFQFTAAQLLKAKIDKVIHLDKVKEMVVSPDKKLFATADDLGMVVLKDVETGKVIAHHKFDGKVYDLFFTKTEGEILAVHKTEIKAKNIFVELYDFLKQSTVHIKVFENKESILPEFDFNPENNTLLLSTDHHYLETYNLDTKATGKCEFELARSIAGFIDNEKIQIISRDTDFSEVKTYEYNYIKNELIELEHDSIEPSYLEFDKNNKHMFRSNGIMKFTNSKLNYTYELEEANFYYNDKRLERTRSRNIDGTRLYDLSLSNFAFSPDGKYLMLVGGQGTSKKTSATLYFNPDNDIPTGYVALYSVEENRLIWRTNNKENQTKYDTNDLDWIDNTTAITSDEKGNTLFYNVNQSTYVRSFFLPKEYCTTSDVSDDFNVIAYALYGLNTMKFETPNGQIKKVSNTFKDFVKAPNADNILFATENITETNKLFNLYLSNDDVPFGLIYKDRIKDVLVSSKGKYACYVSYNNRETLMIKVDELITTEKSDTIGFVSNGFKYFCEKFDQEIILGRLIDLTSKTLITIININNPNDCFSFINEGTDIIQFSKNEKYISIFQTKKSCLVFNIDKKEFIQTNTKSSFSFKLNFFDKNSEIAFGINHNHEFIVWNTENETVISKNKINESLMKRFDENMNFIREAEINKIKNEIIFKSQYDFFIYDYKSGQLKQVENDNFVRHFEISPGGKHVYTHEYSDSLNLLITRIKNMNTGIIVYEEIENEVNDEDEFFGHTLPVYFHKSKPLAFLHNKYSRFTLFDLEKETTLATLKFLPNGEWVVFTPNGIFDGSKEGRKSLYYLAGTEVILYNQLKETYWESNLLYKLINNPASIGSFKSNKNIALHPKVTIQNSNTDTEFNIFLDTLGRSGGIGKTSLYLNGKEIIEDINPQRQNNLKVNIDSLGSRLIPFEVNSIGIKAYNTEGWLSGRVVNFYFGLDENLKKGVDNIDNQIASRRRRRSETKKFGLYGLFIGTSEYDNEALNLNFADKDARVLTDAFKKVSAAMYDTTNINLKVLSSITEDDNLKSTKKNIVSSLQDIADNANVNDIVVLFFSGHGITIEDDFYYLTSPAGNIDIKNNLSRRQETCISSNEIKEALRKIKSNKQIMILDACHSGQITSILDGGAKALTTSQQKALESLEDKMGVYILASSESNQKSFESSSLQQGLLTFTILRGLSGEASTKDSIINVVDLLNYASLESENISKRILKEVQRPVLGIAKGGSSFPIGIENNSLRVEILDNKKQISKPNFAVSPLFNDPEQFESAMLQRLEERGGIGSQERFIFISRDSKISHKITGTYSIENNNIHVLWNLIKNNQKQAGPFEISSSLSDKKQLIDDIIDQAVEAIK